jgi:GT2 family glycosyltransferase
VNWNGGADTVECLESLMQQDDADFSVVVVDNGSEDDSVARIEAWAAASAGADYDTPAWARRTRTRRQTPDLERIAGTVSLPLPNRRITLIEAGRNLGFAAANNLGMRFAAGDSGARYFWLLNNDTIVAPDALGRQVQAMADRPDFGILGARLMFYDRPDMVQGLAGGFHRWRARGFHIGAGLAEEALPQPSEVERQMAYVMGASMFVRRAFYEQVGPIAEDYFLYFEELDWLMQAGGRWRPGVVHDAVVWHKEGASIGSSSRARASDTSLYYLAAGLLRFYRRHLPLRTPLALARVARDMAGLARRRDRAGITALMLAVQDVARGRRRQGRYGSTEFQSKEMPSS